MNILIVVSKFPPEYSGPGVRIPRLYESIAKDLGAENNIEVICNGLERPHDEHYVHKGLPVHRLVCGLIRRGGFPFNLLPSKINIILAYNIETLKTLLALARLKTKPDLLHILGTSGGTAAALWWAKQHHIPTLIEIGDNRGAA